MCGKIDLMILTTTSEIQGFEITNYLGLVSATVVVGSDSNKDLMLPIKNLFGGRAESYEQILHKVRQKAEQEISSKALKLNARAVIGISYSYQEISAKNRMLVIHLTGTAVN